jgi:RNA polymerase sigma-70 factor (ECF subfamily)
MLGVISGLRKRDESSSMYPSSVATVLPAAHADAQANAPPVGVTFDEVYAEYFEMVWRAARRLGTPEASVDDVTQDVFLVLHRRLPEFDEARASLRSWIYGVVVRVVRDHRRTFRRKESRNVPLVTDAVSEAPVPSPAPAPSDVAERNEAFALLCALLDELDQDKRELLVLSELEEMTVPEIARVLGANVQTVYSRLRAARKAFDQAYARHLARSSRRRP